MTWKTTNTAKGENKLYSDAKGVPPSLDLRFASQKNLNDYITGTPLVDHQRSMSGSNLSPGTYVGSDGLIKTATTNLLLRSEEFDNAVWSNIAGTVTRNANATVAPDGTLTADELVFPSADVGIAQNLTVLSGVTYTVSIWIKGTAGQTIRFTTNSIPVPPGTPSNVTLTGDWVRYSYTNVSTGTRATLNLSTFGGATARNIYVWGAQLEQSSTVGEYVKTTDLPSAAPRFDYDPTTGESLGLLIEESRTNYCINSENPAGWFVANGASKQTFTAVTAPDGSTLTQGFRLPDGGSRVYPTLSSPGTVVPVSSFYVRSVSGTATINLFIQGVNVSSNISVPSDRWLRISGTSASNNVTAFSVRGNFSQSEDVYIWGAQLEVGSFPTSYIPTTGTALTRSADVASITGSNFSGFYNQGPGSWFAIARGGRSSGSSASRIVGVDGSRAFISTKAFDSNGWNAFDGTNNPTITNGQEHYDAFGKIAVGYDENTLSIVSNPAITSSVPSLHGSTTYSAITIGGRTDNTNEQLNGIISRLTYFPERLPDATLQAITS